ncbi:MAG: hypothetical protein WCX75_00870 [Fibrobacteraceae bacterium]
MSHLTKNTKKIILMGALSILLLSACHDNASSNKTPYEGGTAAVRLDIGDMEMPLLDSITIDCMGADTTHLVSTSIDNIFSMDLLPFNPWVFRARVYANGGLLTQEGETEATVNAGDQLDLLIQLRALIGFIYLEIPLGLGNPLGIESGTLKIISNHVDTTYTFELDDKEATLGTKALALGETYFIKINLFNALKDTVYAFSDSILINADNSFPTIILESLRGEISVSIQMQTMSPLEWQATFSTSKKRTPIAGDLLITEFFADPKSSGTKFEFVEIYNGTLDSLILDSCTLAESSSKTETLLPANTVIPPSTFWVLGSDSVNAADVIIDTLGLPKTSHALVFHCKSEVIDSLWYNSKTDSTNTNPFPLATGKTTQLPLDNWKTQEAGTSWCLGNSTFQFGGNIFYGSPGKDASCP